MLTDFSTMQLPRQSGHAALRRRLLGDVVARERADTAGATVDADAPSVVIATHDGDEVSLA